MNLQEQNILFFSRTMGQGGTENVVLQLCEIFKPVVNKIVVCSCGGVNVKKLESMGIQHYEIPDIENKSLKTIKQTITILRKIIKKENITVIHTHHRMAAFYVAILKIYKKCTFINTCHNTFDNKISLTKYAYKHAKLIACGEMVKKNLTDVFDIPLRQISVIHNAVKEFNGNIIPDTAIEARRKQGKILIGNIGRLSEQKGMEYFINAIPDVVSRHDNVHFLIVGTGEDENKLKNLADNLEINEYISFLGYRNNIQNIMCQIDFIVLSSLWEGLPLTPIEAYSVGKTVIGTKVDGTIEIIRDGVDGLLVDPKNSEQIADKINYLIENRDVLQKLEIEAKQRYKDKFSFDKFEEQYIRIYKEL